MHLAPIAIEPLAPSTRSTPLHVSTMYFNCHGASKNTIDLAQHWIDRTGPWTILCLAETWFTPYHDAALHLPAAITESDRPPHNPRSTGHKTEGLLLLAGPSAHAHLAVIAKSRYSITARLAPPGQDPITLAFVYLPPSLANPTVTTILSALPRCDFLLGDVNARLGPAVGDTTTGPRERVSALSHYTMRHDLHLRKPTRSDQNRYDHLWSRSNQHASWHYQRNDALRSDHGVMCAAIITTPSRFTTAATPSRIRRYRLTLLQERPQLAAYAGQYFDATWAPLLHAANERLQAYTSQPDAQQTRDNITSIINAIWTIFERALHTTASHCCGTFNTRKALQGPDPLARQLYPDDAAAATNVPVHDAQVPHAAQPPQEPPPTAADTNATQVPPTQHPPTQAPLPPRIAQESPSDFATRLFRRAMRGDAKRDLLTPRDPAGDVTTEALRHYTNIFSPPSTRAANELPPPNPRARRPRATWQLIFTPASIKTTLDKYPTSKSGGADGLHTILLRSLASNSTAFAKCYADFFAECAHVGCTPTAWNHAIVHLLPKNRAEPHPDKTRPISLTPITRRIFEKILLAYWETRPWTSMHPAQGGFRSGYSTTSHALLADHHATNHFPSPPPIQVFLDFKNAFDFVPHDSIIDTLREKGCPPEDLSLIFSLTCHKGLSTLVINGTAVPPHQDIPRRRGVVQGSILSPLIFNLFIDELATLGNPPTHAPHQAPAAHHVPAQQAQQQHLLPQRPPQEPEQAQPRPRPRRPQVAPAPPARHAAPPPRHNKFHTLLFCDDTRIEANDQQHAQDLLDICNRWATARGMAWNVSKCAVSAPRPTKLTINRQDIPQIADSYKYLGFLTSHRGVDWIKSATIRIQKARRLLASLCAAGAAWPSWARLSIINTFVRPTAAYGSEIAFMQATRTKQDPASAQLLKDINDLHQACINWATATTRPKAVQEAMTGLGSATHQQEEALARLCRHLHDLDPNNPLTAAISTLHGNPSKTSPLLHHLLHSKLHDEHARLIASLPANTPRAARPTLKTFLKDKRIANNISSRGTLHKYITHDARHPRTAADPVIYDINISASTRSRAAEWRRGTATLHRTCSECKQPLNRRHITECHLLDDTQYAQRHQAAVDTTAAKLRSSRYPANHYTIIDHAINNKHYNDFQHLLQLLLDRCPWEPP